MTLHSTIVVTIQYFAQMREKAGRQAEDLTTTAGTPGELLDILIEKYGFTIAPRSLCVAVNDEYASMGTALCDGDSVAFIPPVAGG